jgi:sugar lactone lactonase YvrE
VISTVAGNGNPGYSGDGGPAASAMLNYPTGVAVDAAGNLFIADEANNRVRKVNPGGVISTVAGNGTQGYSGDGGPATSAELYYPYGVAVDTAGNLFIADEGNNRIRMVTPGGVISTVAGNGIFGFSGHNGDGGPATSAMLAAPEDVAVDTAGNLFIADTWSNSVRKVTPGGVISTVAGNGTGGYSGDGGPATSAILAAPEDVAVDTAGNLFIADDGNQRIRMVTPGGVISTVAGNGTGGYSGDGGPATSAELYYPSGVAVDTAGNLFIADFDNQRVRMVTGVASVTTFFPQVAVGGGSDTLFTITNTGSTAASGNLILTDQQGNPFTVSSVLTDSSGTTQPASVGSSFSIYVPAGGTVFLSANALSPNNPTSSGWAELESTGGSLTGVATYEDVSGGIMQYIVGVLQSPLLQFATIPVDNDNTQDKQMAYAIVNPSSQTISIKLALVG